MRRTRNVLGALATVGSFGLTALLSALAGCGAAPTIPPTNDFNRPTDVQFMCFGAFAADGETEQHVSGRPMRACHPQDATEGSALDWPVLEGYMIGGR